MNTQNFGKSDIGSASGGILTVRELLSNQHLAIPDYQRPYKWTTQHVNQLLGDVANHRNKSAYRLGTVVFHEEKGENNEGKKNIVDGQQRTAYGKAEALRGGIFIYRCHIQGHGVTLLCDGCSIKNGEGIALPTQETYASFLMTSWPL